jgi:hypothetical protein
VTPRQFLSVCLVFALPIGGCQTSTNERVLVRHEPAGRLDVRKAPYHGRYRLYASPAGHAATTRETVVVLTERLAKGDSIGFARDRSGALVAVVRDEQTRLSDAAPGAAVAVAYCWTMQPDAGQLDHVRTALLVLTTVAVVGVIVGIAAAASSSSEPITINWPL